MFAYESQLREYSSTAVLQRLSTDSLSDAIFFGFR